MIPRTEWMDFAVNQLEFNGPFKTTHQSYDEDYLEWQRAYIERDSKALEVADKYVAYRITQRLKS